jgi:DNA-binding Xre family transcriptional regulator
MTPNSRGRRSQRNVLTYGRIVSKVAEIAAKRGYAITNGPHRGKINIQKLNRISGISTASLWYLLRRPETFLSLDVHTLAKLCFALDCQPGDLLRYERVPGPLKEGHVALGSADDDDIDSLPGVS